MSAPDRINSKNSQCPVEEFVGNISQFSENSRFLIASVLTVVLVLIHTSVALAETSLEIVVEGATPGDGQIIVSVFDSEQTYLSKPIVSLVQKVDANGSSRFMLSELNFGDYAISAIYDKNEDGTLNTNLLGIPTEQLGFSNNVSSAFGPPKFDRTKFFVNAPTSILIYLGAPGI